ncbi:hypothetical protein [Halopseudomonas salegens]|uniref:Uncharacterized protein n=1 Tax=Halopseudomonas salegens TaxID=1434072 RepID=A0A1H2GN80_9GAMM|nr:hypothetical protein [Halopseudomonas salegens]SDU21136.1 hypothetical protein SAMN05216210_2435 [Halopseudomonas salegens]
MFQVDKSTWHIYDPDNILSSRREGFDTGILRFGGDIHPREDLMQFTHRLSNCIVDFGYYGCEINLDGFYAVSVVDGHMEEGWQSPMERLESRDFLAGITHVQAMLEKYT